MLKLKGGERLYVSVNQGCTELEKQVGRREAAAELRRRADLMRRKIENIPAGFSSQALELGSQQWLGRLYEAGNVFGGGSSVPDSFALA